MTFTFLGLVEMLRNLGYSGMVYVHDFDHVGMVVCAVACAFCDINPDLINMYQDRVIDCVSYFRHDNIVHVILYN